MISASSIDVREVESSQQQNTNAKTHHYVAIIINGMEVFKSAKVPCVPTPQWKMEKTIRFTPTSDIYFAIYRNSRAFGRLKPVIVAECSARGIDFLDTSVEQQLVDNSGKLRIAVKFNLVIESHVEFMKAVKQEVSRLAKVKKADASQRATTVGAGIGTVLKAMVPVIDNFAGAHPILNGAWIVLSSAYKIAQNQVTQDGAVQDLIDSLSKMAGAASSWEEPRELPDTDGVIEEIGKASLEVATLVHDYVLQVRAFTRALSDMPSRIEKSQALLQGLTMKLESRVRRDTKARMKIVQRGDGRRNRNRAEVKFSTSGISGNATVQNAGGHIINGDYTMRQTASIGEIDRHTFHDTNTRMKSVQHGLEKMEVLKWIYTVDLDTSLSYNAAQKVHLSGTGTWFLDGLQFSEWKAQPGSVLWLYGGPGCGKTVLSYSAIKHVIDVCNLRPLLRGYAYFFFDARNDKLQDFSHEKFIRSLITQLSDRCGDDTPAALISMYHACDNGHRQPSLKSLEETLLQVLECFEDVYIVIDALDECADNSKSDLLNWIESVTSKASGKLHLMATSRPEKRIAQGLASLLGSRIQKVSVTDASTESDISALFDAELGKMAKWKILERPRIKTAILPRSGGMFRWVVLQLHDVSECSSKKALYEQLESLPKGLDETYARIFKRSKDPNVLQKLLQWLAFSQREMTVKEIAEVAAVDLSRAEGPLYDPDMRYEEPAEVLNFCYGFVTEVEGIIKLAHFSVKEYLIKHIQPAPGRTSVQLSHSVIAQTCLALLLYFDKPSIIPWSQDRWELLGSRRRIFSSFPLSRYAAGYWVSHFHFANADATDGPRLLKLLQCLFALPRSYAMTSWVLLHDPHSQPDCLWHTNMIRLDAIASPLYYACVAGLTELVGHLIAEGADINTVGADYESSTPLLAAIEAGDLELAELLLEKGADANLTGLSLNTALKAAIKAGDLELAELLLENGGDVDVTEKALLQEASKGRHLAITKLLLEHGADVNAVGEMDGTTLFAASERGDLEIAKLLLEHGANVNATGGIYSTALQMASRHSHLEIVKLLLEHGADANIKEGELLLQAVSDRGNLEIAKLLLEYGADVNAAGEMDGTALQAASRRSNLEITKLLLEHGADVNAAGGIYGTALQMASRQGRLEIVKLLLEHGADVNAKEGESLLVASKRGHFAITKLLLEHGADVNVAGETDSTALQAASERGHLEIAKLLLEHGADVNIAGGIYGTAVQAGLRQGRFEIVKLLLEKGGDVDALDGTSLLAASCAGHLEIVKLLLEKGANFDGNRGMHETALWSATAQGHVEIAQLLRSCTS